MPQNKYSAFKREELGHSKKLSDQNKTETHQDKHQILQLHVRYLGRSHRLGSPSAFAACAHTASLGWLHSVPPAFFSCCPWFRPLRSWSFIAILALLSCTGFSGPPWSYSKPATDCLASIILQNHGRKLQGPSVFYFLYLRWLILPSSAASLGSSLAPGPQFATASVCAFLSWFLD